MGSFAVIGLGRFGESVAKTLVSLGHEVLGIDIAEEKVQELSEHLTQVVIADTRHEDVLKKLGIRNFDGVVIAIGQNIEANILTTIIVSQLGTKNIIAKAQSDIHGEVLKRVGANKVVFPEKDMGQKVAHSIVSGNILDFIELSSKHSIAECTAPINFIGKSLGALDLRAKHGISVLAIKKGDKIIVSPGAGNLIEENDLLVILGCNEDIDVYIG
ncbi:MAG: potassium uptake system protein [Desulfitibacter sp. BRH_c19]|nr:MAG: potassium uptake system protein [Desulfitibacter sp. BRH_c19]